MAQCALNLNELHTDRDGRREMREMMLYVVSEWQVLISSVKGLLICFLKRNYTTTRRPLNVFILCIKAIETKY